MKNMNNEIADYFLSDARDFLDRYKLLEENATHIGLRSKLLVELIFSIECALKSLIFIESKESEKETYKKAKKQGHDINKLVACLEPDSREQFSRIMTVDLSQYEVYCRYQLESQIDFREPVGVLGEKYYSTIADFTWLDNIYKNISEFLDYIEIKNPVKFTIKTLTDIDINEELEKRKTLTNIRNK
jgi:hypothetical protein